MTKKQEAPAGFKKVSRAPFFKWETVGQSFTGVFLRLEPTQKYEGAVIVKMVNDSGERQGVACPTMLKELLDGIEPGTAVHIVYTADEDTGEASPMKVFEVYTK